MEEESSISTASDSEYDPEKSTDSDSLSGNDRTEWTKRKLRKRNRTGPSSSCTLKKRKAEGNQKSSNSSLYLRQQFGNKSELPVTCGDKDGILHVEKYNDMEKCILSEGQWFMPNKFEKFGGKERSKKWKTSILCRNIPLQKLIEAGILSSFKKSQILNQETDSPESSPVADRLRKRKCQRQLLSSSSESSSSKDDENEAIVDEDDEDIIDMTMFEVPLLPVTCAAGSGILHKCRFATGHCGRCIRTKDFWLTPEDFIRLNKREGMWRKDILSSGIPLGKLIMKRVLELHVINCNCKICEDQDQDQNDDMCYVCDSEEDLLCCDTCPRAFHSLCHLPTVHKDSLGSQWSCTFCVMEKIKDSNQKTQQDVLSSPVSQYTLHCQYLLLHLLHESKTNVPGFSENIFGLGRMKLKLANNDYQTVQEFVRDIEQVFKNCYTSNEDSDLSRMTSRLKKVFKREFDNIFQLL